MGKAQNEALTHQLIDFLVGDKDGLQKDPSYIYRMYMALKKYEDAAKTALIIARQEQDLGNYPLAHQVIVETIRHLEDASIKVSLQLRQSFVLLHSYILVKLNVKRNDHLSAARLLLRVAQNISKFPQHIVPLLTSTVIECQRAGLKASSYEYAVMLVRPEYRSQIVDEKLKRKIEAIVRRRFAQGDEIPEEQSACPISTQMIAVTQLECPTTRDALPMCVVTGRHVLLEDFCFCPISKFPAIYSEYVRYIREMAAQQLPQTEESSSSSSTAMVNVDMLNSFSAPDPIHGKSVFVRDLVLVPKEDAMKYIQRYNNVLEKKEGEGEDGGGKDGAAGEGEGSVDGNGSTVTGDGDGIGARAAAGNKRGKNGGKAVSKAKMDRLNRSKKRRGGGGSGGKSDGGAI